MGGVRVMTISEFFSQQMEDFIATEFVKNAGNKAIRFNMKEFKASKEYEKLKEFAKEYGFKIGSMSKQTLYTFSETYKNIKPRLEFLQSKMSEEELGRFFDFYNKYGYGNYTEVVSRNIEEQELGDTSIMSHFMNEYPEEYDILSKYGVLGDVLNKFQTETVSEIIRRLSKRKHSYKDAMKKYRDELEGALISEAVKYKSEKL